MAHGFLQGLLKGRSGFNRRDLLRRGSWFTLASAAAPKWGNAESKAATASTVPSEHSALYEAHRRSSGYQRARYVYDSDRFAIAAASEGCDAEGFAQLCADG